MKSIIALLMMTVGIPAMAADKVLQNVSCMVDGVANGKISEIDALTTDHKPNGTDDEQKEIWKRAEIPGFPGYYVQIWSYPGPLTEEQEIDLRVKSKDQLGTYDMLGWSSGYGESDLGVTLPGAKKVSFEITCSAFN